MDDQASTRNCPSCGGGTGGCPSCKGGNPAFPSGAQVTLVGAVTAAFPGIAVEKQFAQLLGKKDFAGQTDRETMHSILDKRENRYLAFNMCFQFTPYGMGTSPAYVVVAEHREDIALLIDTLKRPPSASEFDVVQGRIVGTAPPAMCNAQQLPIVAFSQLYSFRVADFIKSIKRPERTPAKEFETACEEVFYRTLRVASNATGVKLGLSYALLHYQGLYQLVAEKFGENSSLTHIGVKPSQSTPNCADIGLKFVGRETQFVETYSFLVNYAGPFQYLEERLHPCYEVSIAA